MSNHPGIKLGKPKPRGNRLCARVSKATRRTSIKYRGDKTKTRENVRQLLNEMEDLIHRAWQSRVTKCCLCLILYIQTGLQESHIPETRRKENKRDVPLVEENQAREYLSQLGTRRFMGYDGMHPLVLRELEEVIARSLSMIFN